MDPKVWEVAFEVTGTKDMGVSFDSRTGIDEVDEVANATLNLIEFRSGRDALLDLGQHARYHRIYMDRIYKNDIENQGRLSVYASDPMRHFFRKNEDVVALTVAYQKKGIDPEIPLEFRQVVRNRVIRGGTNKYITSFHWDSTLGNDYGRLRIESNDDHPEVVVSSVFYPRLAMDHPYFERMKDFTAIRDYMTAVINRDTKEILDCVAWQFQWHISHFGCVAVEKGSTAVKLDDVSILQALLGKEGG
jgi:hypothetical protein